MRGATVGEWRERSRGARRVGRFTTGRAQQRKTQCRTGSWTDLPAALAELPGAAAPEGRAVKGATGPPPRGGSCRPVWWGTPAEIRAVRRGWPRSASRLVFFRVLS